MEKEKKKRNLARLAPHGNQLLNHQIFCLLEVEMGLECFSQKHPNGEQTAESKHQKPHRTPKRLHHSAAYDSQKALPELPLSEPPSCKWLPPARRGVETDRTPPSDCRSQTTGQFNEIFNMGMNQNLCLSQKLAG